MEVIKAFMEMKKMGKDIQDTECLVEEFQKYPSLYGKGNKGCKGRETRKKMLGEQFSSF